MKFAASTEAERVAAMVDNVLSGEPYDLAMWRQIRAAASGFFRPEDKRCVAVALVRLLGFVGAPASAGPLQTSTNPIAMLLEILARGAPGA